MDYLAHGLWGYAIYRKTPRPWWGVLWCVFPDTISWVPFLIYRLASGEVGPPSYILPPWMDVLYGLSHSVVIFSLVALGVYVVMRRLPIYFWGWLIHIAIDVPTHATGRWPTPFLWPLHNVTFPGVSWGEQWFMIANYALFAIVFISIYYRGRNVHRHNHSNLNHQER